MRLTPARAWIAAGVAAVLLALGAGLGARQTNYFASNCDGAAYPLCGFAEELDTNNGVYVNRTRVTDGCPDGTDSVRFEMIPVSTGLTQFYFGWGKTSVAGWNPAAGDTFYLKYRIKPDASITWSGNGDVFGSKFVLFNAGVDTQRLITSLRDNGANDTMGIQSQLNIGGGSTGGMTLDAWNAVVQGFSLATTASANDGAVSTWIATSGTFSLGTPTTSNTGLDIEDDANRTGFYLGHFTSTTLALDGAVGFEICNVVLTDTFDTNWPTATPPAPSSGPTRLRIRGNE